MTSVVLCDMNTLPSRNGNNGKVSAFIGVDSRIDSASGHLLLKICLRATLKEDKGTTVIASRAELNPLARSIICVDVSTMFS